MCDNSIIVIDLSLPEFKVDVCKSFCKVLNADASFKLKRISANKYTMLYYSALSANAYTYDILYYLRGYTNWHFTVHITGIF